MPEPRPLDRQLKREWPGVPAEGESLSSKAYGPRGFVPFWCRVGAHRWRVATLQLKGTCQCERCGKLKGAGA